MKELYIFALARHGGPYETWPTMTELFKEEVSTGKNISGYVIEAQYEHQYGFLLVTSWDCPYEEAQLFLLLSHELDVMSEKPSAEQTHPFVWRDMKQSITIQSNFIAMAI